MSHNDFQCRYHTKTNNERCKRTALPRRDFCWQHESKLFKGVTITGFFGVVLVIIGLFADLSALGFPVPTLQPPSTAVATTLPTGTLAPTARPTVAATLVPTQPQPTDTPWAGPCQIDEFTVQPPSPQPVGTFISIVIKANCIGDVRAIRLMINGEWYDEKGGHIAPPDEFGLNWQTAEYDTGEYQLTAEVATWGDDNWENSASSTLVFVLTEP
ncbi:MAG: hypothetical protein KC449_05720 [Anaerolineales bacterium]|nr:hypothetical protein [Anaerolineales bacterium]